MKSTCVVLLHAGIATLHPCTTCVVLLHAGIATSMYYLRCAPARRHCYIHVLPALCSCTQALLHPCSKKNRVQITLNAVFYSIDYLLDSLFILFTGTNTNDSVYIEDKNLTVTNFTGLSNTNDGFDAAIKIFFF